MIALLAIVFGACHAPLVDLHAEAPGRVLAAVPVCVEVAVKARSAGVSAGTVTRLSYREARFRRDLCSPVGACGPLQAVAGYWCSGGEPCDLVAAGVRAWAHYLGKARGDERLALCWYTGRRGCS